MFLIFSQIGDNQIASIFPSQMDVKGRSEKSAVKWKKHLILGFVWQSAQKK